MNRLSLIFICALILTGCETKTPEIDSDKYLLKNHEERIESLEKELEIRVEEVAVLNELVAYVENIELRDDIPTSEYTIKELSELYTEVQDGYDLNMYGGNLTQIFFDIGIREFISEVAKLDDEEIYEDIANAFLYSITSNRELYYINDIDSKLILQKMENEFFYSKNYNLSDNENEVIHIFLNEIWNIYKWLD